MISQSQSDWLKRKGSEFDLGRTVLKNRDLRRLERTSRESLMPFTERAALCSWLSPMLYESTIDC